AEYMGDDPYPGNDLVGALLHQDIVGGDIGLALGAVDDQGVDGLLGAELYGSGKPGTAKPGNAGIADQPQQRRGAGGGVILHTVVGAPFIASVGHQHHTDCTHAGGVENGVVLNGADGARGGRVDGGADKPARFRQQ